MAAAGPSHVELVIRDGVVRSVAATHQSRSSKGVLMRIILFSGTYTCSSCVPELVVAADGKPYDHVRTDGGRRVKGACQ